MNESIYSIPPHLLSAYRHGDWVVRTDEPASLPATLAAEDPERVVAVQLLALAADSEALNAWAPGLPIELVMADPASEYPLLYRHTNLLDKHPVRAVVPVRSGFLKAIKVAVSLDFAVRLELGQPEPPLIEELIAALEFYLHQPTVAQPVEFFHSMLLGFYHDDPLPLWSVLDEDPRYLRYVADDGAESLYGRLATGGDAAVEPDTELEGWIERGLAAAEDCRSCEFLRSCGGYFKWPRRDYDCSGVKRLFGRLHAAAMELRRDLDAAPA
ncbi:MAG TPA: hypothetical protein PKY50_00030 [Candidatus Competibacter sp.]|nr:hypothetical protein [Candidatus Competibacter sp.]